MKNEDLLKEFSGILEAEANEKVTKAIRTWIKCDDAYKRVVLHASGFSGPITACSLRDHFDMLDLMDALDTYIEEMEWDTENNSNS